VALPHSAVEVVETKTETDAAAAAAAAVVAADNDDYDDAAVQVVC
jgi:hypothetical protein